MPSRHVLFIIVLLIVTIFLLFVATKFRKESFAEKPKPDVFATNVLQHSLWYKKKLRLFKYNILNWKAVAPLLNEPSLRSKFSENDKVLMIADPYDADRIWKGSKKIQDAPKGYFVILNDLGKAVRDLQCSYNLAGKRIGVMDRSDELFLRAMLKGYRIPDSQVHIEQVPIDRWDYLQEELKRLDAIVCYLIPGSAFHKLLQTQEVSVRGFRNVDVERIRLFYPYVTLEEVNLPTVLNDVPGSELRIMAKERETSLLSMKMRVIQLASGNNTEGFVTRLEIPSSSMDPTYRCVGDPTIESESLCESAFDVMGMPKKYSTTWDRPCVEDSDCPFFKANKNYQNRRGGCDKDGFCEFPIGIKRIGYRKYDDQGPYAPFCYQCKVPEDPECCESQKHSWTLVSPDYAFANDTVERKRRGMTKTTVDTL